MNELVCKQHELNSMILVYVCTDPRPHWSTRPFPAGLCGWSRPQLSCWKTTRRLTGQWWGLINFYSFITCLSVCLSLSLSLSLAGTTELISTRLDTKHPWVKENQFCSNDYEGDHLSPTGNNSKIVKWYWIFFSRTKLDILQSKRKGIQFWSN